MSETQVAAPSAAASVRADKSVTLLDQYKLLGAVIDTKWATALDHKVARHVIDRWFGRHGNSRASLRYLEAKTGATRSNVIASLRKIIDHGAISLLRQGIGTRPSEYDLNLDFAKTPSGIADNTAASGTASNTSCGTVDSTTTTASGTADGTKTHLRSSLTSELTVSDPNSPAVPSAPPMDGLKPATADAALVERQLKTGFEELWDAYGHKTKRKEAKRSYDRLPNDPVLHDLLVAQALNWFEHYERNGTDKNWRKRLHTWLDDECYLEDPPPKFESAKDAGIANAVRNSSKSKDARPSKWPVGIHDVEVVTCDVIGDHFSSEAIARLRIVHGPHEGLEFPAQFCIVSQDEDLMCTGLEAFNTFQNATGIPNVRDTSDLVGAPLRVIVGSRQAIRYERRASHRNKQDHHKVALIQQNIGVID